MPLDAGKLRHVVDIEEVTNVQDSVTGEITQSWAVLHCDVPCSIEPLSVKDYLQSRTDQSEISVRVVIRHFTGLDATMRLVGKCSCHLGKVYNPSGWLEDPESGREWLTAPCSQGVNDG